MLLTICNFIGIVYAMNKEQYIGSRSMTELAAIQTAKAAEMIAELGNFDQFAGDLITRNLFVLTDRLSVAEYAELSESTKQEIEEVARFSRLYLPLDTDELLGTSYDDAVTRHYRENIQSPLLKLQKTLHNKDLNTESDLTQPPAQDVVSKAGKAFAHAILEAEYLPAIAETTVYFNDNATAALNRLNTLQAEPYFSEKPVIL